jgi:hypothetical protein
MPPSNIQAVERRIIDIFIIQPAIDERGTVAPIRAIGPLQV